MEGAPAGFILNSRMKQQIEKTNTHHRTSEWELEGAPCRIHRKFTYETASRKNKRTQPNFGEGVGGSPAGFIVNLRMRQQAEKTNAHNRTSVWESEGALAGFSVNLRMKQQGEKTNARNRTSVWELEGAPAAFTVNSHMKRQVEKQTRATKLR